MSSFLDKPKIFGMILTQDGINELPMAINSILPVTDQIFIVDGGSTDGTSDWLKENKKKFNLNIFERKYDNQMEQKNYLLQQIPVHSWIVGIDQDETINFAIKDSLVKITDDIYHNHRDLLEINKEDSAVVAFEIPVINLVNDTQYFDLFYAFKQKIFFYDNRKIHFFPCDISLYHLEIGYNSGQPFYYPIFIENAAIFHHAYQNKERLLKREGERKLHEIEKEKIKNVPINYLKSVLI